MDAPLTRRGLLGTAAALTALGAGTAAATAAAPTAGAVSAALPPIKDNGRRQGTYEEQVLAAPGEWGVLNFRIPALAVAPNGDLLAAFDKRPVHGDSPAPNSIWQRRSRDGGLTWEEPTVVRAGLESEAPGRSSATPIPPTWSMSRPGRSSCSACSRRTPACGTARTAATMRTVA